MMSWRNILRLVLMVFHFLFTLVPLGLCYAQTGDLALVAVHAQAFIAVLVYIPAAFVHAILDSPSRFTQAGGEVGYLVVQQCLWLRFGAYWGSASVNRAAHNAGVANTDTITAGYQAAAGFGFVQFFLTLSWMIWVICAVHSSGDDVHETFKIATHIVLDGLVSSPKPRRSKNGKGGQRGSGGARGMEEGSYEEKKGLHDCRQRESALKAAPQGHAYTPVDTGRRDSQASRQGLYREPQQQLQYSQSSNQYQDPYQQQQQIPQHSQQRPHDQYAPYRRGSAHYDAPPSHVPHPMYAQQGTSTPSLYESAPSTQQQQPLHPYRQSQIYDAQATPIAPRPAESIRSASPAPAMTQSRQAPPISAPAPVVIEAPRQVYQSRASQRYLQHQQQQQPQQTDLHRPSPPWEGTPASRRSSNESRRSVDLPRIQTNV